MDGIEKNKIIFFDYVEKLLKNNILSHAYLIEVNNYEDDYKLVLSFVKMILCTKNLKNIQSLNCGDCNVCKLVDDGSYPDLIVIEPDGNFIKKEQIIQLENEFSNYSLLSNKRIYIIKEAEKMNGYSANSMLKFLEEPCDDVIAILLTTNRYKIIDTIISRCQLLSLKSIVELKDFDKFIVLLDNMVFIDDLFINYDFIISSLFLNNENKVDKNIVKNYFIDLSILFLDYYNNDKLNVSEELLLILNKISKDKIFNYICIIQNELYKLNFNVNTKLWLDMLFSKFIGGNL